MNYSGRPYRAECLALPKGWIREEYPRVSSGINGGRKSDVYYVSPSGKRVRSKPELLKALGNDRYDLTAFDYQTGKINPHLIRNPKPGSQLNSGSQGSGGGPGQNSHPGSGSAGGGKMVNGRGGSGSSQGYDITRGLRTDNTLVPPIRQTASIFKQPVTVHKIAPPSPTEKPANAPQPTKKNPSTLEKPRQIFWEKRLSGLRASYPDEEFQAFSLPQHFKPIGPSVEADVLLASISTSLHMSNGTLRGQGAASKAKPDDDISAYINPEQPLMGATTVTQDDVEKQEAKVNATRARLAKALEALSG